MSDGGRTQSNEKTPRSPDAAKHKKKFDPLGLRRRFRPNTRDNKTGDGGKPTQIGFSTQSVTPTSSSSDPKKLRKKAVGPIEEEDKTQFERPEGVKSQPAVTGKHKEQQTGDEKLQKMFKKKKRKLTDDEKTEFERCRGAARPAISKGKRNTGLRWKKSGTDPKSEVQRDEQSDGGSLIQQLSESGSDISQMSVIDRKEEKPRKLKPNGRDDTCEDTQAEDAMVKISIRPKAEKKKSVTLVPVLVGVKYIPSTTMIPEAKTPPYATPTTTTPDPSVTARETNKEVEKEKPKKEEPKVSKPTTPPLIPPREEKARPKKIKEVTCDETVEATQENEPDKKSPQPQSRPKSDDESPASVSLVPYIAPRVSPTYFTESSYIMDILDKPKSKSPQKHKNDQNPPSPNN